MKRSWHLATLGLILSVALGMRLYRLKELPPGLFHDEAYNTLDADALAKGLPHPRFYDSWEVYSREIHTTWPPESTRFPVFLEGNYGREALYHYFGALAVWMFGRHVWSLRLVSAVAGVLGVFGTYWVTRELFAANPNRATRLGLLAAAVATGIYSLLAFSRLGLRIITLVTLETLTIALWLRAGRTGRWYWWASAGLLLGLSQYTYIPARSLPAIVALPTIVWYAQTRARRRQLMVGGAAALLIALLIAAPLIGFFLRYPAYLTLRAEAIAVDQAERGLDVMLANVGRVFLGIFARGDSNPILNLPGRPLLDVFHSVFFFVGLAVCLKRFTSPPILLILFWGAAMFAPSVISGIAPTFGRSIGALPSLVIIVSLGIDLAWAYAARQSSHRQAILTALIVGMLCLSVGIAAHDYFVSWAAWPDLDKILHQDVATVGRYIRGLPDNSSVYVTPTQKYSASLLLAIGEREPPKDFYGPVGLLPAGVPQNETWYIVMREDAESPELLESNFPRGIWVTETDLFRAYRVPASTVCSSLQDGISGNFVALIRLCEHSESSVNLNPGDELRVKLTWQALSVIDQRFTAFVHLLGPANPATGSPLWAQDDHEPGQGTYATDRWSQGEIVIEGFQLRIPEDAPVGEYTLTTGFYSLDSMERLGRSDSSGDVIELAKVMLTE